MKQRLAIAATPHRDPEVLILMNLPMARILKGIAEVRQILRRIADSG